MQVTTFRVFKDAPSEVQVAAHKKMMQIKIEEFSSKATLHIISYLNLNVVNVNNLSPVRETRDILSTSNIRVKDSNILKANRRKGRTIIFLTAL